MNLHLPPEERRPLFWLSLGMALIALIGVLDYLTGPEIASSFFYLLPISMVAWYMGKWPGIALSIISACAWFAADVAAGSIYSSALIYSWNALVRLGFFLVIAMLLAALRMRLQHEKEMARTDYLTGAINSRFFYDLVAMEINRSLRNKKPFATAYLDLDNFKLVNDQLGHLSGDQVLKSVVDCVRSASRKTDVIARVGGDEFMLLLPETDETGARAALNKIHSRLEVEMRANGWPVTFSIGVVIFAAPPQAVDEIVRLTDNLMYVVKKNGKNAVKYQVYSY
jgi:diguanylate cyclase (GGDEF)-like protein